MDENKYKVLFIVYFYFYLLTTLLALITKFPYIFIIVNILIFLSLCWFESKTYIKHKQHIFNTRTLISHSFEVILSNIFTYFITMPLIVIFVPFDLWFHAISYVSVIIPTLFLLLYIQIKKLSD